MVIDKIILNFVGEKQIKNTPIICQILKRIEIKKNIQILILVSR